MSNFPGNRSMLSVRGHTAWAVAVPSACEVCKTHRPFPQVGEVICEVVRLVRCLAEDVPPPVWHGRRPPPSVTRSGERFRVGDGQLPRVGDALSAPVRSVRP